MDENLKSFLGGEQKIEKPLVIYKDDKIIDETLATDNAKVAIAEGTYTSLLNNITTRIFIDRNYLDTRAYYARDARAPRET